MELTDDERSLVRALLSHFRLGISAQLRRDKLEKRLTDAGRAQYERDIALAVSAETKIAGEQVAA